MAILKIKDIKKMNSKDIDGKIAELRMQLVRAGVTANKATAKTKEIKRTLARLITVSKSAKEELKNK
ncbi:MAG: 50S ribosomal protein L29 [archaeon]|jgi:ribosomal protein L29|nr:50S ribosomal protein L29 [archaeon]